MAPRLLAAVAVGLAALLSARAADTGGSAPTRALADDLNVTGACKTAIASFCSSETPGDGRVARCVRGVIRAAKARKEASPVTPMCAVQVWQFFQKLAAAGINPFAPGLMTAEPVTGFRQACQQDIQKICRSAPNPFVMTCLKAHKGNLTADCRQKIFKVQTLQAENLMLDAPLANACKEDILKGCEFTNPPGAQLACLKGHRKSLTGSCRTEVFRREKEDAEDIRLNMDVFTTCKPEITASCKDFEFGKARMLKCLWDASMKRGITAYSERCRQKVQNLTRRSVSDYRLDFRVRTSCDRDINEFCSKQRERVDRLSIQELFGTNGQQGYFSEGQSGQVLRCLKAHFTKLKAPLCKEAMTQVVRIQAAHAASDPVLMRSCNWDLSQHCQGSKPGEVHACLRKNIKDLTPKCREEELLQGALEARDITLKPKLFYDCKQAMGMFCKDLTTGAAQMLKCLQDHRTKSDFPETCKTSLQADLMASNNDWRLKFGISEHCKPEMERMCWEQMRQGGGAGLTCLKKHYQNVTLQGCKRELRRYVKQGTEDIRLAPNVYGKCMADVERWCKDISPGSGRVFDCLYRKKRDLTLPCAEAAFQTESLQTHDMSASAGLWQKCAASRKQLCPDVPTGHGELLKCMEDKRNDEGMASECKEEIEKHLKRKHEEFGLNPGLEKQCTETARKLCPNQMVAAAFKDLTSAGGVITCLIHKRKLINDTNCKRELWRQEKQRTSNMSLDPAAREVCRADTAKFCLGVSRGGLGETRKCLAAHMKELSQACSKKVKEYFELASEDIRFKRQMRKLCTSAFKRWCSDKRVGSGNVIPCLLNHMHETEMEPECRDELVEEQTWRSTDIIYNPALKANCKSDLLKLLSSSKCGNATATGWKINCLTKNKKDLRAPECKKSVLGIMQRQSADLRAKPGMQAACKEDIQRLCPGIPAGGARLQQCLGKKVAEMKSARCKKMVQEVQNRDKNSAAINWNVRKNCYNEKRVFCKDAPLEEEGALLGCLAQNMNASQFSKGCRISLENTDLKTALKKAPETYSVEGLKVWMMQHRSVLERYTWVLLGGTVAFVILLGFVISYFVIQRKMLFAAYNTVAPRDQPDDLEQ